MKVIIAGAGASGIACAIRIKQNNPSSEVTVIERLDEICKKLYATGNGRCNLSNKKASGNKTTEEFFSSLGLVIRTDGEGRQYPYSNQAKTVVDVLKNACEKYTVNIVTSCRAEKAQYKNNMYYVYTEHGVYKSDILVLAAGGKAQPSLGSDGSGYSIAESMGLKISPLFPALVQLVSPNKNCRILSGIRTKADVSIEIDGEIRGKEYGEVLFTDYGLSGIVIMNLSLLIDEEKLKNKSQRCTAVIDFIPEMSESELEEHIKKFGSLCGILPQKLCSVLQRQSGGDSMLAAKYAKNQRIAVTSSKGFDYAQITRGGVLMNLLTDCFESKSAPGLYVIGELCDKSFKCGGYNLDFAFSSAVTAADNINSKYGE